MTKKKHTASRMLLALVALTLVSFCFLGSTFARYTTTGTGTATTQVAKWKITATNGFTEEGGATIGFNKLSPSMAAWSSYTEGEERTNTTELIKVADIANDGDVGALVTIALVDTVASFTPDNLGNEEAIPNTSGATILDAKNRFSINLYWTTDSTGANLQTNPSNIEVDPQEVVYIFATVTWTSLDTRGEAIADALDTWIGENITEVSWDLKFTAVQNTELPA